jgi:class 3 adenylate cyclase/tetratricopeptide (TPR) repeat protein
VSDREELERAMASLDGQRTALGDAAVEAALAGLRDKLAALQDAGDGAKPSDSLTGERRVVTVLFSDVKGSTEMAGQFDPEEWAGIMKRAMGYLISPVTRLDGTVARLMGDSILAFFGAPTAHEDDPRRAVRAGLEIVSGIADFREELARERGLDFNVRVGINTGLVFVGAIGATSRFEYTAVGDTMNLAARMEQTAQPGTVQITAQTFKLVEPAFEFEPLGGIQVKGKREPVVAYRVLRPRAASARAPRPGGQAGESPLVGREAELRSIKERVARLVETGEGGVIGIIGEAGLGKSRLIAEARPAPEAALWLEGQTLSFGQTISYWPFQQILRSWAGITEEDDTAVMWSKLDGQVRGLFGEEADEYLPYLGTMLGLEVPAEHAERVKFLDGEAMRRQVFLSVRRLVDHLARTQPLVLVFEDLHWMDETSSELLQHLLPLVESVPLLVVGLSRLDAGTPAVALRDTFARDHGDRYLEIQLTPLTADDGSQLIRNLLAIDDLPARVERVILDKAEGNPFFVEEVTRALIDAGAVVRDPASGRWRATPEIGAIQIPDTVQGVIVARIDRLDEEVRQVLRVASVVGRSFLHRLLTAVSDAGDRLDDDLAALQRGDLIRERRHLPELEYMFKHALAQEATYESILLQRRRELHASVGRAIESLFADRLEEFYGLLAYHYARAEVWEKAQEYLLKAADRAGDLAADAEALALYERALDVYGSHSASPLTPVQRASVERRVGEALVRRGEPAQALDHFHRALGLLGHPFPQSPAAVRRAILGEALGQLRRRVFSRSSPAPVDQSVSPAAEEAYRLHEGLASIFLLTDLQAGLLASLRGLNLAERSGFLYGMIRGSTFIGVGLDFVARFGFAEGYHRRAKRLAAQSGDPRLLGVASYGMALHEVITGRLDAAFGHVAEAVEANRAAGDLREWGAANFMIGQTLAWSGRFAEALERGAELARLGRDASDPFLEACGEMVQGLAHKGTGDLEQAADHLRRSIDLGAKASYYYAGLVSGGELAQCALRSGDMDSAAAAIEAAEKLRPLYLSPGGNAFIPLVHAQAERLLLAAERSSGPERDRWLRQAGPACRDAMKRIKFFELGAPEAMLLQGRFDWLSGRTSAARDWWDKSAREAARLGMRYDEGLAHAEIGSRLSDRAELETATAIFSEIGARRDLARTSEIGLKSATEGRPEG